jgi:multidrug efflux pump subunit AcrB
VTVIAAMLLSVVVALILTPVLCASLLKPVGKGHGAAESGFFCSGLFSGGLTGPFCGPGTGTRPWSA